MLHHLIKHARLLRMRLQVSEACQLPGCFMRNAAVQGCVKVFPSTPRALRGPKPRGIMHAVVTIGPEQLGTWRVTDLVLGSDRKDVHRGKQPQKAAQWFILHATFAGQFTYV